VSDPGSWLVEERRRLGLSRTELASRLGVAPSTVGRWERGERRVAHPSMLRLALDALARRGAPPPAAGEPRARAGHAVTWRLWRAGGGH
jgi:transcriptional regulator with XRE-family HTH domain